MAAMGPSRLELSRPVFAAVAGGMELALWCDIRVMEETGVDSGRGQNLTLRACPGLRAGVANGVSATDIRR